MKNLCFNGLGRLGQTKAVFFVVGFFNVLINGFPRNYMSFFPGSFQGFAFFYRHVRLCLRVYRLLRWKVFWRRRRMFRKLQLIGCRQLWVQIDQNGRYLYLLVSEVMGSPLVHRLLKGPPTPDKLQETLKYNKQPSLHLPYFSGQTVEFFR